MFEDTYVHMYLVGILYVYMIVQSCNLTISLAVILHVGPDNLMLINSDYIFYRYVIHDIISISHCYNLKVILTQIWLLEFQLI